MVAGERRWRAARKAGLRKIPSIIRNLDDTENALVALIENMQREDLNPIEEAEAFENIIETYKITQEALARTVGKSRPYVSNTLRLTRMPLEIIEFIRAGELSRGHANAIGSLRNKDKQLELARFIVKNGLSVREAENLSVDMTGTEEGKEKPAKNAKKSAKKEKPEIKAVEDELTTSLGAKVTISSNNGKNGKIEIHYYNYDELNELIDVLRKLK
jgi:ParB family chromosome partitioning protein